jgi:hypothetical protein
MTDISDFLYCSRQDVVNLVIEHGSPSTGIFVSNGNRRLILAKTPYPSKLETYAQNYINAVKTKTLETIQIFFSYGLKNLVFPLFSDSVLDRKEPYKHVVQEIIIFLFGDRQFLELYDQYQISIKTYGNLSYLKNVSLEKCYDLIVDCVNKTASYKNSNILFGIGSKDEVGTDLIKCSVDFYKQYSREPTVKEIKTSYYSFDLPEAEFYIVSSSFKAHVIPPLVCGKGTQYYYLPAPSTLGFNEITYRKILFDLIFKRKEVNIDFSNLTFKKENIEKLRSRFIRDKDKVIGLGENIGNFWVIKT